MHHTYKLAHAMYALDDATHLEDGSNNDDRPLDYIE